MATITKSEIIAATFTRNLSTDHILDSDIAIATRDYVTAYIVDAVDVDSALYENYCKPVIAFGVIVNIWNRIATEVTDRGMVQMQLQGAGQLDPDSKARLKSEYMASLYSLIAVMVDAADDEGLEVNEFDYNLIGYTGQESVGSL